MDAQFMAILEVCGFNPHFPFDFPHFGTRFAPNPWKTGLRTLNMPS
jgi:hypothetical protein